MKSIQAWLLAGAAVLATAPCLAQSDYPAKPLRLIVPFPAGGSTDIVGRVVAQRLAERLGRQVVVDNRGGAGGTIGTDAAAKAPADGYTIVIGTTSTHAVAPAAYSKLGYHPVRDFAAVAMVAVTPYLLVVNPQVGPRSLKDLIALAKASPGRLNYGSAGNGSTTHLAMEMLKDAAQVNLVHVPYKGNAQTDLAVLGNEVQAVFGSMPALLQHVKAGKLVPLAVGTAARSPALPDVATVAEQGYAGFEASLWLGVFAPAGTPRPIVDRLARDLAAIAATAEFKDAMDKNGAQAQSNSPEQFARMVAEEAARYAKVVGALGIKLD
ncbi:MAG: tripartite tricarboxylate transporter substrate binding protein [Burkholderiales bacterium]|nr:tripartite tricarboxylate transporter substrate binding protein [Burkholderiales bacterium]